MSNAGAPIAELNEEFSGTPYEFIKAIGHGGMGAVYEVKHRTLKRKLVIKILREADRPDLEDRLRLEAQTLAQLTHPNLLSVVDYAHTPKGRPYLVSERLKGATLKTATTVHGLMPVADSVRYAVQALAGLAVAHRAGVVHRDVKLDNLYLCDGDEITPPHIKVIDFGIAKLVGAEESRTAFPVAPLANPTAEGTAIGTPSFMSPEQVTNLPVDQRADIYGVGAVLYRLLTGRNVFTGRDLLDIAVAHATELPKPPSQFAQLPPGLDDVVLRSLEKDPNNRFQSAKEMIDALAPFARGDASARGVPDVPDAPAPGLMISRDSGPLAPEHTEVMAQPAAKPSPATPVVSAAKARSPVETIAIAVAVISVVAIMYFALVLLKVVG